MFNYVLLNFIFYPPSLSFQTMSEKEKTRFHQMAEKDKKRYESEMANYKPTDKGGKGKGAKGGKRKRTKDPNAPKRALYVFYL